MLQLSKAPWGTQSLYQEVSVLKTENKKNTRKDLFVTCILLCTDDF